MGAIEKGLKGSEIVIRCLEELGVEIIFAYPGGQAIELHQALSHSDKLRVILPRHEQGGAFAAVGYARKLERSNYVFLDGYILYKIEILENIPYLITS